MKRKGDQLPDWFIIAVAFLGGAIAIATVLWLLIAAFQPST